jgi:2'-5' RNA ligase
LSAPATLRAFIAIELPKDLRAQLAEVIARLSRTAPEGAVRWVRADGIHLTLKFLGDMPVSQTDQMQDMLRLAAREAEPFECKASGIGCFPSARQPRVIWAALHEPTGSLGHLQRAVEAGAARLGYPKETGERGFKPHVTLGRLGRQAGPADVRRVAEAVQTAAVGDLGSLVVEAISLMKSELRPGGSVYTRLYLARLGES